MLHTTKNQYPIPDNKKCYIQVLCVPERMFMFRKRFSCSLQVLIVHNTNLTRTKGLNRNNYFKETFSSINAQHCGLVLHVFGRYIHTLGRCCKTRYLVLIWSTGE